MSFLPFPLRTLLGGLSLLVSLQASGAPPVWTGGGPGGEIWCLAIDPITSSTVYAGSPTGVFKTTDAGGTWAPTSVGLTSLSVHALAIDPLIPSNVYAGTADGMFRSTDSGGAWTEMAVGLHLWVTAFVIDPADTSTLYAGTSPGVFKSTDAGGAWALVSTGVTGVNALVVDPVTPATLYAATGVGAFKSNFRPALTRANNAILRLPADGTGRMNVLNSSSGTVHAIVDVSGYFE